MNDFNEFVNVLLIQAIATRDIFFIAITYAAQQGLNRGPKAT